MARRANRAGRRAATEPRAARRGDAGRRQAVPAASAKAPAGGNGAPPGRQAAGARGPGGGWAAAAAVGGLAVGAFLLLWPDRGPWVLVRTALDVGSAGLLLAAATALGALIVRWLGVGGLPRGLAVLLALALGVGAISLTMLGLGVAGLIGPRWVFPAVFAAAGSVGAVPLWRLWRYSRPPAADGAASGRWAWSALVLAPAALVVLAGANMPAGVLWSGNLPAPVAGAEAFVDLEGRGYDALEYHLQTPREYLDGGRVRFLAHNVYSAFPANAEMWFMAAMGLVGRPQEAVYLIHWLNVLLAAAAVWAVSVASRLGGGSASGGGVPAAVALAATPMLASVAVVAYVEPMMLMFMAVCWAMLRHYQLSADGPNGAASPVGGDLPGGGELPGGGLPPGGLTRHSELLLPEPTADLAPAALAIGLLLGLAAGTKYLALPLLAGPLAVGLLAVGGLSRLSADRKLRHAMLAATGLLLAFAPWLVRNAAQTGGNPLSPLLWSVFGGDYWTAADAARWNHAHLPAMPLADRLAAAWWRGGSHPSFTLLGGAAPDRAMAGSSLHGPWLWLLAWPIFFARSRSRWDWLLLLVVLCQAAFWLLISHVPGRFILPAALPLALLVGRSMAAARPAVRGAMLVVLLSFAAVSGVQLFDRFRGDTSFAGEPGEPRVWAAGALLRSGPELFEQGDATAGQVNRILDRARDAGLAPDRHPILWLVGDARPFYIRYPVNYQVVFSHDVLADVLASQPPALARRWLREAGLRYIFVDWLEVARLRGSYGFADSINERTLSALGKVTPLGRVHPGPDPPPDQNPQSPKKAIGDPHPADYWLIDLAGAEESPDPPGPEGRVP